MEALVMHPVARFVIWLNDWFVRPAGGGGRPPFLDIDEIYPALRTLEAQYPAIRDEVLAVMDDVEHVPPYDALDPGQHCIASVTPGRWRVYYLWAMGARAEPHSTLCPRTSAALAAVPGLFQAHFSILDPGKSVPAHNGPYSGYLRYHLGLVVPEVDPPRLRVADQVRAWRNGEGMLFDDRFEHEVYNTSSEFRVVLIVDVLRPMPLPQRIVNRALLPIIRRFYGRPVLERAREFAEAAEPDRAA